LQQEVPKPWQQAGHLTVKIKDLSLKRTGVARLDWSHGPLWTFQYCSNRARLTETLNYHYFRRAMILHADMISTKKIELHLKQWKLLCTHTRAAK
jgi:hypothetical protein